MGKIVNLIPPLNRGRGGGNIYSELKILSPTSFKVTDVNGGGGSYLLPIPKELNDIFVQDWQQKELGQSLIDSLITGGNAGAGAGSSGNIDPMVPIAQIVQETGVLAGAAAQAQRNAGLAKNNVNTLLFQASGMRTFQFSWDLIPTNAADGAKQQAMIKEIRKAMHPELSSNISFVSPNLFAFSITVSGTKLIKTLPCAMTNFNVNYIGSNIAAFHEDGTPVHTVITIELQEVTPNTKQSIKQLYG